MLYLNINIDRVSGLDRHSLKQDPSMDSAFNGDMAREDGVARCVGDAVKLYSGVDIMANNAGIGSSCRHLLDQDLAAWERIITMNLRDPCLFAKQMPRRAIHNILGRAYSPDLLWL